MRACFCGYPVFGTDKETKIGYCKNHQWKRTDLKKKEYTPRKPIAVRSTKKPVHKIDWGFTSQIDLFMDLWEKARDEHGLVICKYSGKILNGYETDMKRFLCCFAHVLNKKNWPLFKLCPDNIRIVLPEFHAIIDQGTLEDRKRHPNWKFDEWDSEVLEMKNRYLEFKRKNLLA